MPEKSDKKIVELAHKRFAAIETAEHENNMLWEEDLKFANGDRDNQYQWLGDSLSAREGKPCLTINKVKKHNRQIINEARQSKPSIRIYPVDDNADIDTADIISDIIRHIESNSNADVAYDIAEEYAVDAGRGFWKITTDYIDNTSFDQEIYIESIINPLSIYLPMPETRNGVLTYDHGFEIEERDKDEFEKEYGEQYPENGDWGILDGGWRSEDKIRLAGYYYTEYKNDTLYANEDGSTFLSSDAPQGVDLSQLKKRKVSIPQIKYCLIAGETIIEKKDWPGKYIPIVPLSGSEIMIDGKIERKGHTRQLKDPQIMYNYWASASTEFVSLQGKQPYIAAAESIRGYEKFWSDANNSHLPYLPFNALDPDTGQPLPSPQRQQPPIIAPAYFQGMQITSEEMLAISGQENAQFGEGKSGQSGRALDALQSKSDVATFHFIDNKARAIRYTGQILLDLIPKIYDTPRIARLLGEDGKENKALIDPSLDGSKLEIVNDLTGKIEKIYNPGIGTYDVIVAVGASYGTRRREAFQMLTQIASQNPAAWQIAGDLIMKAADFPQTKEVDAMAERFQKTLPPGLQDKKDGEQQPQIPQEIQVKIQQDQQQIAQAQNMLKALDETIQKMQLELDDKSIEQRKLMIEEYKAETDRLKVTQQSMSPDQIQAIVLQMLNDLASNNVAPLPQQMPQPQQNNPVAASPAVITQDQINAPQPQQQIMLQQPMQQPPINTQENF